MTRVETIAKFFKRMSDAYVIDQQSKGMYASGVSAKELRVITEPEGGKLFGKSYWHFQKVGRKPGGFPPIDTILQWIRDKRITSDLPEKSLAFLIARKIAKKGTDIFQRKRDGINVSDELLEARKELATDMGQMLKDEFIKKLKEVAEKVNSNN